MDKKVFYDTVRQAFGPLDQKQVDGYEQLLNSGQNRLIPLNQLAYIIATSWHETAHTQQPIAEYGKGAGKKYGQPTQYDGQVAYGRGYVQLTWDYNYERADAALRLSGALLANFDLALDPLIASNIIFEGMIGGWFTSKALGTYVAANESKKDYFNARRVVNGTDCADKIAGYAESYEKGLRAANYDPHEIIPPDVVVEVPPPDVVITEPPPDPPIPDVPPEPPIEPPPSGEIEQPPRPPFLDQPLANPKAATLALIGLGALVAMSLKNEA